MADKKQKPKGKQTKRVLSKPHLKEGDEALDAWMKSRLLAKPDDQLDLTEPELGEEITRVLSYTNTNVVPNLVVYSFKESAYVLCPRPDNTVIIFQQEGTALHLDSEEAKDQIEEGDIAYPLPMPRYSIQEVRDEGEEEGEDEGDDDDDQHEKKADGKDKAAEQAAEGEEDGEEEEEAEEEANEEEDAQAEEQEEGDEGRDEEGGTGAVVQQQTRSKKRKLINQFNFCERAALTYNNPKRDVDTQTIPPARSQFGGTVLQWIIYDSYEKDFAQQNVEKKDDKKTAAARHKEETAKKLNKKLEAEILNQKYLRCWLILERMINQNIFDDVANDYRYWEDPADEFREEEGTLLPLWKFQYDRVKKLSITHMVFNPFYYDLFAVCFGSHEFMKPTLEGFVCLFTIKNPSFPDYIIPTKSGVMCCDIHSKYPFLLVIGLYDGNVAVFNLKDDFQNPLYQSTTIDSKHSECIWEIRWGPDMPDGEINFYSVSSDGCVLNWVLMQDKLATTLIITLYLDNRIVSGPDGTELRLKSCGSCMCFHPTDPEIFLIGSEEGFIYKCSIAFSSRYLMTYNAHSLAVYRIDYNRFNSNIFISCSGDWRVKIWEDMREDPLFIFDLGGAVGDVKWAPYSSTVFAACTADGKIFVYDLNVNKYKPICMQSVVPKRRCKLTRLVFNEKLPFIIVGDDKGAVTSVKLSPNLRLMCKPPKKQLHLDQNYLHVQKLDRLLSLVRELPEGVVVPDTTTTVQS